MATLPGLIGALGVIAAGIVCTPVVAVEHSRVPGTRVALQAPDGFTPSSRFPGFEHAAQGASIMVSEMPAGYGELRAGFTRDGLASRGMKLIESRDVEIDGAGAMLVQVSQRAAGIEFLKWMLLAPQGKESVLVVGTFPRAAPASFDAQMHDAVLSASLKTDGKANVLEEFPFGVDEGSRLKIARRMGNMLLLNRRGTMSPAAVGDPVYVVGMSISRVAVGDLQRFSEQRARQTAEVSNLRGLTGRRVQLNGLDGYELIGDASDLRSGLPLKFYQVIAPDGAGYFIFQGLVGSEGAAEYLAEFRRLTDSFKRRSVAAGKTESARQ